MFTLRLALTFLKNLLVSKNVRLKTVKALVLPTERTDAIPALLHITCVIVSKGVLTDTMWIVTVLTTHVLMRIK